MNNIFIVNPLSWGMGKKQIWANSCKFEYGMDDGITQAGFSLSETADLLG